MDDPELEAIRRARMAELQSRQGGGSGGAPGAGGMGSGGFGGAPMRGQAGGRGGEGKDQEAEAEAQEEMKRQALSTILDPEARDRLSRISLVKPSKARAIQDLLIRMAQSGQVRQKVTEQQLIGLLDQVEGNSQTGGLGGGGASGGAGKITYNRKKTLDDDDDDFDL